MRFGESEIANEKLYAAKRPMEIWDVNVDNIIISKLVKSKNWFQVFDRIFRWSYKTVSFHNA